jgi:hypothetical protein
MFNFEEGLVLEVFLSSLYSQYCYQPSSANFNSICN